MFYYVESENFLSNKDKKFIDNVILSNNFPYKYRTQCVPGDGNSFMVHNALERPKKGERIQSNYFEQLGQILISFCRKNNIKLNEILRTAVNLTFNNGSKQSPDHVDHDYPHKQLIVYFNDCKDKNSYTVILDKNKKKSFIAGTASDPIRAKNNNWRLAHSFSSLIILLEKTPSSINYLKGETYKILLSKFIPRVIWKEKPNDTIANSIGKKYN